MSYVAFPQTAHKPSVSRPDDHAPDRVMLAHYGPHALQTLKWSRAPSAKSQSWKTETLRWFNVIRRAERPQISESKDGEAICYVDLDGPRAEGRDKKTGEPWQAAEGTTQRLYENLVAVYFIAFDYDDGDINADDMIERLTTLSYEAVFYTTHSHLKTVTRPTDAQVAKAKELKLDLISYLTREGALPRISDPAPQLLPDGGISHAPWPKFRVVLLLKEPFAIGKNKANVDRYKNGYHALAKLIGASTIDKACVDPARIHYPPKKRNKDAPYVYKHIRGDTVDFNAIVNDAPSYKAHAARPNSASSVSSAFSRKERAIRPTGSSEALTVEPVTDADLAEALEALACIDPDVPHPKWMSLLWALHSKFSDTPVAEQALTGLIDWSRRGAKFNKSKDDEAYLRDEWATADKRGGSQIATLIYLAEEYGYRRKQPPTTVKPALSIETEADRIAFTASQRNIADLIASLRRG